MNRLVMLAVVVSVGAVGAVGCGDNDGPFGKGPSEPAAGCNPLIGDDCLTPFPSSFHMRADATSATGMRVALLEGQLPVSNAGVHIHVDRFNQKDGFSPATPFLIYFAQGVDPANLPGLKRIGDSLTATAAAQVIDFATGVRVPCMAELDANAGASDRQALIVRPMIRLTPGKRYVIALVGLKDPAGHPIEPAPFKALRDGAPLNQALAALAPRYQEIFAALDRAGVVRANLSLAWDVVIASDATATSHLIAMRDHALAMADAGQLAYHITTVTDTPSDPHVLREIQATIQVPWYLTSTMSNASMDFGPDGQPRAQTLNDVPIVIEIPQCAKTAAGPLPYVVVGHGLFGNALDTLRTGKLQSFADDMCVIMVATDWIGLASGDLAVIGNNVLPDFNHINIVTDHLQQAQVNAQVMSRLFATHLKDDDALKLGNSPITDGVVKYYFGASLGGIEGTAFMALSPDIVRGVLNVPGCEWNLMMFRSVLFTDLAAIIDIVYPDTLDRQVLIAGSQSDWDYTDAATFAPHLLHDPLPGAPVKRILVQESIGDTAVPNLSTEVLARTMGLTGLDLETVPYGVPTASAPLDSAYTQWDIHPTPLPGPTNVPPPGDNGAHAGIQTIPALQTQIKAFLRPDGVVTSTCGGPCSF